MGSILARVAVLALVFAAVAGIMLKVMPAPLKDSDYLVIGTVATLVSMVAIFLLLVKGSGKKSNVFFKGRYSVW